MCPRRSLSSKVVCPRRSLPRKWCVPIAPIPIAPTKVVCPRRSSSTAARHQRSESRNSSPLKRNRFLKGQAWGRLVPNHPLTTTKVVCPHSVPFGSLKWCVPIRFFRLFGSFGKWCVPIRFKWCVPIRFKVVCPHSVQSGVSPFGSSIRFSKRSLATAGEPCRCITTSTIPARSPNLVESPPDVAARVPAGDGPDILHAMKWGLRTGCPAAS